MSDGVVIPLDVDDSRARGKVSRLKRDAQQAGAAYGKAAGTLGRVGGAAGGAFGRALGGFQGGIGMGVLGMGIAGVGMGLNVLMQRDQERMNLARARVISQQEASGRARSVVEAQDNTARGGKAWISTMREYLSGGGTMGSLQGSLAAGKMRGLTGRQSLEAANAARASGVGSFEIMRGLETGLLGEDAGSVAEQIRKFGSLEGAVAASRNISVEEAGGLTSRSLTNPAFKKLNAAATAGNPVEEAQIAALVSGETAKVLSADARDTLNPGPRLAAEAARKAMEVVEQLQAAAAAQSTMGALLAEMGRVIGVSDGAATRQLEAGAIAAGGG